MGLPSPIFILLPHKLLLLLPILLIVLTPTPIVLKAVLTVDVVGAVAVTPSIALAAKFVMAPHILQLVVITDFLNPQCLIPTTPLLLLLLPISQIMNLHLSFIILPHLHQLLYLHPLIHFNHPI